MTLLTTEIHVAQPDTIIVFAADRRITRGNKRSGSEQKIFRVGSRQAAIGYFGLAAVPKGPRQQTMAEWVQTFARRTSPKETLAQIAERLASELNAAIPPALRAIERSGFHLAGFNATAQPEFWYIRNVDDSGTSRLRKYEAREDFQRRDVVTVNAGEYCAYRNGDVRAHVAIWEAIDKGLGALLTAPDFRPMVHVKHYRRWASFKMDLIARFYKKYCTTSIIGAPIDAMAFSPTVFEGPKT